MESTDTAVASNTLDFLSSIPFSAFTLCDLAIYCCSLIIKGGKHLVYEGIRASQPETQESWVPSLGLEDPWRRKWQPTPVFLPGESHGQRSLMGYSSKGRKKSDMTKRRSIKAKIMKLLEESMRKSL